jgi:hypothetical protein
MLAELPLESLCAMFDEMLAAQDSRADVRGALKAFAEEHDIPL